MPRLSPHRGDRPATARAHARRGFSPARPAAGAGLLIGGDLLRCGRRGGPPARGVQRFVSRPGSDPTEDQPCVRRAGSTAAGLALSRPVVGARAAGGDDRRRRRRARLVPPDRPGDGDEPPGRALSRRARPHLVGGQDEARARDRRARRSSTAPTARSLASLPATGSGPTCTS